MPLLVLALFCDSKLTHENKQPKSGSMAATRQVIINNGGQVVAQVVVADIPSLRKVFFFVCHPF